MARYTGPKVKLSRRVGVPIADSPKHTSKRQLVFPGMHGYRGRRLRDYGIRLNEKQKLKYHYGVLEKQFRRYVAEAGRMKGNTGEMLLQLMERRLDNVVRRVGLARTVWASRQLVAHGHVRVNGRKVDVPSFRVTENDIVEVRPSSVELTPFVVARAEAGERDVPAWLEVIPSKMRVLVHGLPVRQQIDSQLQEQLIVELYSK